MDDYTKGVIETHNNAVKADRMRKALVAERNILRQSPAAETSSGNPRDNDKAAGVIAEYLIHATEDSLARLYDLVRDHKTAREAAASLAPAR